MMEEHEFGKEGTRDVDRELGVESPGMRSPRNLSPGTRGQLEDEWVRDEGVTWMVKETDRRGM